ncbi:MAG: ferrous iron transport protein B, partial [Bacillota bacterium]
MALAGNPNCGKTTLFNALTGLRQKVANYPGITVERKTGRCKLPDGRSVEIVDLPGTYSLISRSPDELVAMEVIRGLRNDTKIPDAVIVVVDASNLQRNLYLVSQLIELGRPLVIALNMMDVAERRGMHVSAEALERELGVPVVPVVGHKRQGIDQLKAAIAQARVAPMPDWPLPQVMREELVVVGGGLAILDSGDDDRPRPHVPKDERFRPAERYQALAERLLIGDHASDLSEIAAREPVASLLKSATQRMGDVGVDPMQADIEAHYGWIEQVASRCVATIDELAAMGNPAPPSFAQHSALSTQRWLNWSEQIDSILIHRVWGLVIFALIMASLFVTIFWLARPIMDGIDTSIHWLAGIVSAAIPDGPIRDLVKDGIFAGVGTVIVFVPQIALLFLFLAILEDSGYLARAAFLMDRVLSKVGLHGKSFIPLLSSFACAIPGILATRTIENRKDRLATILVTPFMSCSARLPDYTLLIGVFFASYGAFAQAGIMLSLYTLGILTAAIIAWLFKGTLLRGPTPAFILEMPSYKLPQVGQVLRQVWTNTREFLTKAGTIIFCMSVVLWAITYYPQP